MTFLEFYLSFFIYSTIGWIWESFLCSPIELKQTTNRGFLIGPYCPIYGLGTCLTWMFLSTIENTFILFLSSAILCCTIEYIIGYGLEKFFHGKWWDYENYPFQIHGRVCLYGLVIFGLANVLIIKITTPFILFALSLLSRGTMISMAVFITLVGITDLVLTISSLKKLNPKLETWHERLYKKSELVFENLSGPSFLSERTNRSGEKIRVRVERFNNMMLKKEANIKKYPKPFRFNFR